MKKYRIMQLFVNLTEITSISSSRELKKLDKNAEKDKISYKNPCKIRCMFLQVGGIMSFYVRVCYFRVLRENCDFFPQRVKSHFVHFTNSTHLQNVGRTRLMPA